MLHDSFRRECALMPALVHGVAVGDRERAQVVAAHIAFVSTILHHHHHGEDVDVWPLLMEHCPAECAPLVEQMEAQHEEVARIGRDIDEGLRDWAGAAGRPREALATTLVRLIPVLREHLADEEKHVVPLMERYITAVEWNEIVEKEAAGVDPSTMALGFGMQMYEGDPEVVDAAIANMPEPVCLVIREVAGQAYAEHSRRVHGTATPPRSGEL